MLFFEGKSCRQIVSKPAPTDGAASKTPRNAEKCPGEWGIRAALAGFARLNQSKAGLLGNPMLECRELYETLALD